MTTTRSPDAIKNANTPKKPEDPDALVFDLREMAYLLKCSVMTVRRRIADGYPHTRKGPRAPIKVNRDDLPYWLEADRIGPPLNRSKRRPRRAA
ncbi:hypothetical protein ACFXA3_00570 [Streptomyces sp. NPDC059456]|uniref:hypothetical protein n=1 Tax=Streptomyces sp. NPDC059456 TaxID=3346838 RepID=UPI0036C49544